MGTGCVLAVGTEERRSVADEGFIAAYICGGCAITRLSLELVEMRFDSLLRVAFLGSL